MATLHLYHGSTAAVPLPDINRCRPHNDYGRGFYCTDDLDLAKEWACLKGCNGFASSYAIETDGLLIVDLNGPGFTILHWLEVLFENRLVRLSTPTMERGARWLKEHFSVDLSDADMVTGYRADDSYFGFARSFLRNEITLGQLGQAMRLGNLGKQYMVKSPVAFESLQFEGSFPADSSIYYPRQCVREEKARAAFADIVAGDTHPEATGPMALDSFFISTLMDASWEDIHERLR